MIRALLVDDERIKREAIATLINWQALNIELIGTCANGQQAYDMIINSKDIVDIIITDIKMPVMDGLQLIEKTSEAYPDIVFIIISGFDSFEYAKQAMQYGVKHYLLKPLSDEEIADALEQAKNEVLYNRQLNELVDIKSLEQKLSTNFSQTVVQIMNAVEEHIGERQLSLKWIAEHVVYMNEDYLSKLFLKETGQKFNSYVLNKKINIAKQMLILDKHKIYEIFGQLGFDTSSRYFSQVFKKYTGLTPTEYRKKHLK